MLRKSLPFGQPSMDPVLMIRMQIVGYALRSGRLLRREVQVNFANRHAPIVRYLWPHKLRAFTSCEQGTEKIAYFQF